MRTIKNVFRKKLRAFLTIFGITIGVFALVVMGAMAEKITLLVDGGTRYFSDKVTVSEGEGMGGMSTNPMSLGRIAELESIEGVAVASAGVTMTLSEEQGAAMGMPDLVVGTDMRGLELESFKLKLTSGRPMEPGDSRKAIVGSDLVNRLGAEVGKAIDIRGESFEVIGITEKTLSAPDNTITIPLRDAQALFHKSLPQVVRAHVQPDDVATDFTVYPQPGNNPDELARRIEEQQAGMKAMGPQVFKERIADSTKIFTSIIFGIALISLLVGGLSVINTMTMAVAERTREIGIRKAIGASDGRIIKQFLAESATIGLIGGFTGLSLGWVFTLVANALGTDAGTVLFLLTGRLALGSVLFALILGLLSGLYPSWRAARMNPVAALRYE